MQKVRPGASPQARTQKSTGGFESSNEAHPEVNGLMPSKVSQLYVPFIYKYNHPVKSRSLQGLLEFRPSLLQHRSSETAGRHTWHSFWHDGRRSCRSVGPGI